MSNDRKKKKNINILPIIITHRSTMAGMGPIPILSTTVLSDNTLAHTTPTGTFLHTTGLHYIHTGTYTAHACMKVA